MAVTAHAYRLPMAAPNDVSALARLLDLGTIRAESIVGIIAQTEGDGYARGFALQSFLLLLARHLDQPMEVVQARLPLMMIGLCAGLMSPHMVVFTREEVARAPSGAKRLAVGVAQTPPFRPEEIGTLAQVHAVAEATRAAMRDAGISDPADVHCVEVKCAGLTAAKLADAQARGARLVSENFTIAGNYSKGASALGVALALGEVPAARIREEAILRDWELYSTVASTSAGGEQSGAWVLLLGNSTRSASDLVVGHGMMRDQLDLPGALDALRSAGLRFEGLPPPEELAKLVAIFVNCGADATSQVRGRRHTIHTDFLAGYAGMQAKAVANAIVGALVQDTMVLASAGWEHQGPRGANLLAVVARAG
jgi:cyanuric acid amidohydrolase